MKEFKGTPGPWVSGWNGGKTGPTTPACDGPTCAGEYFEYIPVGYGTETVCIAVDQSKSPRQGSLAANAHLIAAAYDLLIEHHGWAKEIGKVYMAVIQGDMVEAKAIIEDMAKISFATGEPVAESHAIAKALGEDYE